MAEIEGCGWYRIAFPLSDNPEELIRDFPCVESAELQLLNVLAHKTPWVIDASAYLSNIKERTI